MPKGCQISPKIPSTTHGQGWSPKSSKSPTKKSGPRLLAYGRSPAHLSLLAYQFCGTDSLFSIPSSFGLVTSFTSRLLWQTQIPGLLLGQYPGSNSVHYQQHQLPRVIHYLWLGSNTINHRLLITIFSILINPSLLTSANTSFRTTIVIIVFLHHCRDHGNNQLLHANRTQLSIVAITFSISFSFISVTTLHTR